MDININEAQTENISNTQKIAGLYVPDFNKDFMFTQKKTDTTQEEYVNAIIAQAQKDFAEGKFQTDSTDFKALQKKYVQEVSPDRKKIITDGLKAIQKQSGLDLKVKDNLVEILLGKVTYNRDSKNAVKYAEFKTQSGETVATYSQNNGWTMLNTEAEANRLMEFDKIYNRAYGEARRASESRSYEDDEAVVLELSSEALSQE